MNDKPAIHYWKLDMPRAEAAKYTQDLCGDEGSNYTENEAEVTCERCVAALRARPGPPGGRPEGEAPSAVPSPSGEVHTLAPDLAQHVRDAVVKERLEIVDLIVRVQSDMNIPRPLVVRRILERIGKRT
jgi:hypothetical protein